MSSTEQLRFADDTVLVTSSREYGLTSAKGGPVCGMGPCIFLSLDLRTRMLKCYVSPVLLYWRSLWDADGPKKNGDPTWS